MFGVSAALISYASWVSLNTSVSSASWTIFLCSQASNRPCHRFRIFDRLIWLLISPWTLSPHVVGRRWVNARYGSQCGKLCRPPLPRLINCAGCIWCGVSLMRSEVSARSWPSCLNLIVVSIVPAPDADFSVDLAKCPSLQVLALGVSSVATARSTIGHMVATMATMTHTVQEIHIIVDTFIDQRSSDCLLDPEIVWPVVWQELASHHHVRTVVVHFSNMLHSGARKLGKTHPWGYLSSFVYLAKQQLRRHGYGGGTFDNHYAIRLHLNCGIHSVQVSRLSRHP